MNQGASPAGFHFLMDYKKCAKYFYWRYIRGLVPKLTPRKLLYGRAVHAGLAAWYMAPSEDPLMKQAAAVDSFRADMVEAKPEYFMLEDFDADLVAGVQVMQEYALAYPVENYIPEAVEQELECLVNDHTRFTGRVDLVMRDLRGNVFIFDHKTTGWSMDMLARTLQISDQSVAYMLLWNANHPDEPAMGVVYNVLRQYKKTIEFRRVLVIKGPSDVQAFKEEAADTFDEIGWRVSNERRWPTNKNSCYLYNRPCVFYDLCSMVGDSERMVEAAYTVDREKKIEESI